MNKKNIVLGLLMGSFLVACGGGGGAGSSSSSSSGGSDLVTSTTPADKATGVDTATKVTATFAENMLGTSIDSSSFTLSTANGATPSSVSFDGSTNIATLTPNSPLGLLQTYKATLANSIANLIGTKITETNWSFSTRDGTWATAEFIEHDNSYGSDARNSRIGIDANGNAVAIWNQAISGASSSVWASHYTAGSGWSAPIAIETGSGANNMYQLNLAVANNGDAIAIWLNFNGSSKYEIWSNRYVAGTGWGSAEKIGASFDLPGELPIDLAMNDKGDVFVIWRRNNGVNETIYSNHYIVGSGWATATEINTFSSDALEPTIAMDSAGNAIAVWRSLASNKLYYTQYITGSGWQTTTEIFYSDAYGTGKLPDIAMNADGKAILVWRSTRAAASYFDGSSWGSVQSFNVGIFSAEKPKAAIDTAGNAFVVWNQVNDSATHYMHSSRYVVGTGWLTPEVIDKSGSKAFNKDHQIKMDGNGNALVIWSDDIGSTEEVIANRYVVGTGWGTAVKIGTSDAVNSEPQIDVGKNGHGVAVWLNQDAGIDSVSVNQFK